MLPSRVSLGTLIPATLALAFLADAAFRPLPRAAVSVRAWEAARAPGGDGPFLPDFTYRTARAYGNLAGLGNLPEARELHPEFFVTDSFGYPNQPGVLSDGRAGVLLYGSSFSVGAEVPFAEALAAQLARRTGMVVYNAASGDYRVAELLEVARRALQPGGTVVLEYPESRDPPGILAVTSPVGVAACRLRLAPAHLAALCARWFSLRRHLEFSPLAVLAQRGRKRLENGGILPNPYATRVVQRRLPDGRAILFLAEDTLRAQRPPSVAEAARYFRWLRGKVEGAGFRLVVLLVPDKYIMYRRLLAPADSAALPGDEYLPDLAVRLRAAGTPVADLSATFREATMQGLSSGTSVYYRDDTHWNARGIALAADALAEVIHQLGRHDAARRAARAR